MNAALGLTALLMGLAGGPHCAAMCGAACGGIARTCAGSRPQSALLGLQAGRIASYALGGALVAAGASALRELGGQMAWLRPLWAMFHLAALALGLWLFLRGRQPAWLEDLGRRLVGARRPGRVSFVPGPLRAAAAGGLWVLLPCGLLQSALVVAALGSTALEGAVVMAAFGLGSAVGLVAGPSLWWRLARAGSHGGQGVATLGIRLAGLALAGISAWALGHGLWRQIGDYVCA